MLSPGYVYATGMISSWRLDVNANDSITASEPRTHTTGQKTMTAYGAVDSDGQGYAYYSTYDGPTYLARLDAANGMLTELRPSTTLSYSSNIVTFSGENTDGYYENGEFFRGSGGKLVRIDGDTQSVGLIAENLRYEWCYRAMNLIRSGPVGAFVVCDGTDFGIRLVHLDQ